MRSRFSTQRATRGVVGVEHCGELHRAVERDPVHQLRVQEVTGAAAHLPDPFVDVAPARDGAIGHVGEERAERRIDLDVERLDLGCRVEELAVYVELRLIPRAVPDANRTTSAVPVEGVELVLRDESLTTDPVHDLQSLPARRLPAVALAKNSKKLAASKPQPLAASAPIVRLASRTQVYR